MLNIINCHLYFTCLAEVEKLYLDSSYACLIINQFFHNAHTKHFTTLCFFIKTPGFIRGALHSTSWPCMKANGLELASVFPLLFSPLEHFQLSWFVSRSIFRILIVHVFLHLLVCEMYLSSLISHFIRLYQSLHQASSDTSSRIISPTRASTVTYPIISLISTPHQAFSNLWFSKRNMFNFNLIYTYLFKSFKQTGHTLCTFLESLMISMLKT